MPRKVFVANEILTASDVNTNLMDQSVMVFDDATARTTAIPTPVEGMVTYLKDTDRVDKFDGTNFVNVDTGGLVAVKSAIRDTPFASGSVSAGGNVAVPDLSITHEVADPANRLIISAFFGAAGNSFGTGETGIAVHDGAGLIAVGASPGSRTAVTAGGRIALNSSVLGVAMPSATFVHTPGAGSKTYTVRAINIRTDTETLFINRMESDTDNESRPRAVSSLVIQEVAV